MSAAGKARGSGPATRGAAAVRRNSAVLLVGGGAFLTALALLLRFYLYAQLALIPAEFSAQLELQDESAAYLDTATWEVVEAASIVRTERFLAQASPGNRGWSTWWVRTETSAGERPIDHVDRRVIVDRSSGTAVNCCGEHVGGDRAVRQAGLVLYWPADAAVDDYPFYDADVRAAPLMRYDGTEEIAGVQTRRFVQTVEETQLPDSSRQVPGNVLGEGSGLVEAARWLELTRTVWIEPESGMLVHAAEERREVLRAADGGGEVLWLEAELELTDGQTADNAQAAARRALLLRGVHDAIPAGLGTMGPLLILIGLAAVRRRSRSGS